MEGKLDRNKDKQKNESKLEGKLNRSKDKQKH